MKWLRWIMWSLFYAVRPRPEDLAGYLRRIGQTSPPWRTFRPNVYRSDEGKEWHVWFRDEQAYVISRQSLQVDLHIGMESGEIVGLTIWDESLKDAVKVAKE